MVLAYVVRFFGIAQGAVDAAFGRISPSLPMAARSLGENTGGTLRPMQHSLVNPLGETILEGTIDLALSDKDEVGRARRDFFPEMGMPGPLVPPPRLRGETARSSSVA